MRNDRRLEDVCAISLLCIIVIFQAVLEKFIEIIFSRLRKGVLVFSA